MKFRVGSVDYTVDEVEGLHVKYNLFGQVTYGNCAIEIDADLSPERKNETIVHELLHGMFFEAGISDQDEDTINRIASVLAQVLRDNDFGFMRIKNEEESE